MDRRKSVLLAINVIGGIAVLGSYAQGLSAHADMTDALWGTLGAGAQRVYTASMLCATVGYFLFTSYVLVGLDPATTRLGAGASGAGYGAFGALYALVLFPSALWLPLTFAYLEQPTSILWWAVRTVLFAVALGSVGLIAAIWTARPVGHPRLRLLGLVGAAAFAFQTAVLDAFVWPAHFPA